MGPITLENVRASSDITVKVRLKDGGMYIAWTSLSDIKAYIFSDLQRAIAGRCDVSIDGDDSTLLICNYSANKPQYPGVNSIVIRANYDGRVKTYDRRAFNIVKRTSAVSGDVILDDPVVDLELEVEDVSSSLLDMAIALAFKAVEEWDQVTVTERGPEGKSAYRVAVDNGFVGTEEEWLDSLVGPEGPRGRQGADGEPGEQGPAGVTSAVVTVDNTTGTPSATAAVNEGVLSIAFSGLKGEQGPQGIQGNTGPQGIQGIPGTPGTPGVTSVEISVDNEVGVPYATATLSNGVLTFSLHNIKGAQGNTGASVEYPFTLVNDLLSGGIDKGLTAEMGKVLGNSIIGADTVLDTQNQAKESGLSINTSNEWQIFSSAIQSSFLQLTGGTYRIQAVDGQCVYAVLNSTTYSDGGTPDFAIGFNGRFTIEANGEETIDVPPGKYLWYRNDSSAPAPRVTLKSNGGLVKKTDIIDNLSSNDTQKPLSAKQGKILAEMDINSERVKIQASGNLTMGGDTANTSAVANDDFRYNKYPATGYRVKKVFITGNQSKLVTIGVYTPGSGISNQQQVSMVNGTVSHDVDIEVPVGSYLCIGNATGLMFSTVGAVYGSYNIDQSADSSADLSFWFEYASDSVPIKEYIDQQYASYIPDALVQIFPKLTGIGDSLMAGYTHQGSVIVNSATARAAGNNWITYLAKRNGLDVHNLAIGSSTAHNWRYADGPSQDNLADITTADIPTDCYFIGIGVNDLRQSLSVGASADIVSNPENNADSFYGNYDYIIRKCLYYNPKANIFVFTIPDSESGNSSYNNAIRYISQLYSQVHCIDLTSTDAFTTGIIASCFANGHYDPLAYNLISSIIEKAVNEYIKTNYNLFKVAPY